MLVQPEVKLSLKTSMTGGRIFLKNIFRTWLDFPENSLIYSCKLGLIGDLSLCQGEGRTVFPKIWNFSFNGLLGPVCKVAGRNVMSAL